VGLGRVGEESRIMANLNEKADVSTLQAVTIELHNTICLLYANFGIEGISPEPHPEYTTDSKLEDAVIDSIDSIQDAILHLYHIIDATISLRRTISADDEDRPKIG